MARHHSIKLESSECEGSRISLVDINVAGNKEPPFSHGVTSREGQMMQVSSGDFGSGRRLGSISQEHIQHAQPKLVDRHDLVTGRRIHHVRGEEEYDRSMSFRWYYPDQVQR